MSWASGTHIPGIHTCKSNSPNNYSKLTVTIHISLPQQFVMSKASELKAYRTLLMITICNILYYKIMIYDYCETKKTENTTNISWML